MLAHARQSKGWALPGAIAHRNDQAGYRDQRPHDRGCERRLQHGGKQCLVDVILGMRSGSADMFTLVGAQAAVLNTSLGSPLLMSHHLVGAIDLFGQRLGAYITFSQTTNSVLLYITPLTTMCSIFASNFPLIVPT